MAACVSFTHEGGIATVTLEHAGKFNAMSRGMWLQLRAIFLELQHQATVGCVLVCGKDGNFCAGGDIAQYPEFRFDTVALRHFHEVEVWGALQAMLDCDVPIVAQIEGNCMGAGVEIASCCDVRLASASARFGAPIARLGFPMAPREAALVGQAVGSTTARAMLLAAEVFDAHHMQGCGFLTRTVADGQTAHAALAMAQRVASLAPQAARLNKQTLRAIFMPNSALGAVDCAQAAINTIANAELPEQLAPPTPPVPNAAQAPGDPYAYAASAEHREGIAAFLEKRTPRF